MRVHQIDILKGLAIIAVCILHACPNEFLLLVGAPFYLHMAVPMFMLIAGYNSALSAERKGISWITIANRAAAIIIPYLIIWFLEVIYLFIKQSPNFEYLLSILVFGGVGPGGYFIPVFLQHIALFPLIYRLAKWDTKKMLIIVFLTGLLIEAVLQFYGISAACYRLLYLRYAFAVALGTALGLSEGYRTRWLAAGALVGIVYVYGAGYLEWKIFRFWPTNQPPSYGLVAAMFILGLRYLPVNSNILSIVGKASYHIYLVQMIFFLVVQQKGLVSTPIIIVAIIAAGMLFQRAIQWISLSNKGLLCFMKLYDRTKRVD